MKTMYCHVETTGRFLFREAITHPDQPHLVRLAWVIADEDKILSESSRLILPGPDWNYEPDAIVAHGVTRERALADGVRLASAMVAFVGALESVQRFVAFNVDFVAKVLLRSAHEAGMSADGMFREVTTLCAMRRATDIIQKPRMEPGGGFLWPKFAEAYRFFAHRDLPSLDMDPVARGAALAHAVFVIDRGIVANQRTTPHE